MAEKAVGIKITADDAELRAVMKRAAQSTTTAFDSMASSVGSFKSALGGLGAAFAVRGVVDSLRSSIDAADELGKLSQKTGIAVDELSKLKYAASLSDVSTEALAKGMKGLSQRMTEAADASSKAGQVMKALGVDINAGAAPALDRIADTFAKLPDGTTKAALAVDIFGKAGADMIPLLNQGAAGVRKLKEEAARLGLVMDAETAKAAEAFNDNMKALNTTSARLGVAFVEILTPSLVRISSAMKEAAIESGILTSLLVGLGGVASEALGLNATEMEKTKRHIREINAELRRLVEIEAAGATDLGNGVVDRSKVVAARNRIAALQEELRITTQLRDAQSGGFQDQVSRAQQHGRGIVGGIDSALEARIKALLGNADAGNKAAKAMRDLGLADAHVTTEIAHRIALQKIANAEFDDEFAKSERQRLAYEGSIGSVRKYAEQIQFETSIMGLSNDEREKAIALRSIETAGIGKQDVAYEKLAATLKEAITNQQAARVRQDEEMRAQMELAQSQTNFVGALTDGLAEFINGTKSAKDAFKSFVSSVEQQLSRLAAQDIAGAIFGGKGTSSSSGLYSFLSSFFPRGGGGDAGSVLAAAGSGWLGPYAKGGAFDSRGEIRKFAFGDVFGSPTAFKYAGGMGVMGEAGPEAVMPLARDRSGRLGVRGEGRGMTIHQTVNISTPSVESFERYGRGQIAAKMYRAIVEGSRNYR